ncbi:hypothetical protein ACFQ38_15785 [Sporosarcina contaminans]|uniref:DUF4064 domain-containing protein n=1 Tax=Sporosarcina contaminans TaxID=633403 RepID=A0ABW3U0D0_9BACL
MLISSKGVVIIETVMKIRNENKKGLWVVIITLLSLLLLFLLTHFFTIYPGGYSIEKRSGEVLIEKGANSKGVVLNNNVLDELKIASLESKITYIKTLWYVGLLFTATCLMGTVTFKRLMFKKVAIITVSLYVVLAILIIFSYVSTISSIENSIIDLIK